ncbi:MAG TPA: response regulator transcription factor, partial [Anaerolineae bacterium]|nr:response regulator transcription factor [Anaerolineae bacterium]HIQ06705.1 response regulator transcription factor [Anaerolineae bacterium]
MPDISRIRVLLADDHAVLRAGLRLLINAQPDMETVSEAQDGVETLAQAEATQPDVVLLDLSMPRLGGLTVLYELRARAPEAQILILTMHADEEYLREALRLGAAGYVVKSAADQELLAAIRAVVRGQVYIHPSMTRSLLEGLLPAPEPMQNDPWEDLSEREQQVIRRVAMGYTNREIAEQLHLSVKTVETYRARAMEKLGLRSRARLVEYALQHNLLS